MPQLSRKYGTELTGEYYNPTQDELVFLKSQTGIEDENELKKHIMRVQAEAYTLYPYPCINLFLFIKLQIASLPSYPQFLQLGKERKDPILLDVGCCFGNDVRKVIADGHSAENIIATDLIAGFWDSGHKLYRSTPETFPVPFLPGDIFDDKLLEPASVHYSPVTTPRPLLSSLKSLTPLNGHVSAIYAAQIFHLFDEAGQLEFAKRLAGLLSSEPGSMIFGIHSGMQQKGQLKDMPHVKDDKYMFCHDPQSWTEMWDGQVFRKGTVRVEASLGRLYAEVAALSGVIYEPLYWCVTRL